MNGKPLLAYSVILAKDVEEISRVFVSTDDEEIAKAKSVIVGQQFGAQITEISSTKDRLKDLTDLE